MSNETKILLDNSNSHQLSGNTLTLSGTTIVKNLQYLTNNSSKYNSRSVPDVSFVTGNTNNLLTKINILSGSTGYLSAGVVGNTDPILIDNNNGTATINSIQALLYHTDNYMGYLYLHNISGGTFTFIDGNEEYIAVKYSGGTATMYKETVGLSINNSNIIPIFTCWRQGTIIHSLNFDRIGLGLSNKIQSAEYHKAKYIRSSDGGLIITESSSPVNRTVIVSSSLVYTGSIHQDILAFNSSTDLLTESTITSGIWTYNNVSVYDNTRYNPLTGPVSLTGNKWSVVWFYRSIGDVKQVFYVLNNSQYNKQADAELATERTDLPILIRNHCMLIGRSIIQYNSATGFMESAFVTSFTASQVINHNDTGNIQGGISGEYYHLKQTNYLNLTGTTSNIQQQINHISGVTNTKLNTPLFNYYTGTTQTILNNKMNVITGATQNNVVVFGSNGSFVDSGISKALIYAGLVM
jgi:hypothetical protein